MQWKSVVTSLALLVFVTKGNLGQDDRNSKEMRAREIFIDSAKTAPSASDGLPRQSGAPPLGLRYAILKGGTRDKCEDLASYSSVDPDGIFQTGDCVRLEIESNTSGYFYAINRGSSGRLIPLAVGTRIQRCETYTVPPNLWFHFTGSAGEERLYLVLSRERVEGLESSNQALIAQALGLGGTASGNGLSGFTSRDIVIEKIKPPSVEPRREQASSDCGTLGSQTLTVVYANEPSLTRVVADIRLIHK